jgi:hypothetical protein
MDNSISQAKWLLIPVFGLCMLVAAAGFAFA